MLVITKTTPKPALQGYDVIERNVTQSNAKTLNNLELMVSVLSNGCWVLPPNQKYSLVFLGVCCEPLGTSAHSLGIMGLNIVDSELGTD